MVWNRYYPQANMSVVVKTFIIDCFQMLKTDLGENRFVCSLPSSANAILAPVALLQCLIRHNVQTVKCTDLQCIGKPF